MKECIVEGECVGKIDIGTDEDAPADSGDGGAPADDNSEEGCEGGCEDQYCCP